MLDETAAAPTDPTHAHQEAPPEDAGPAVIVDMQDEGEAARLGRALGELAVRQITAPRPMLRNLAELAPEAVHGEGGPLALAGDPPQSTNTEVSFPSETPPPAPPPDAEQTVDFGRGVKVPIATVRAFYNPTCTLHCQEGVLVRAGRGSLCFCALKRCRDEVVRSRSARAAARPLPGVSTQVNPRDLESVDKLSERAARLDAQIAEKDQAAAGEIAALIAQADACDGGATLYTLEIRQAEEGLEVLAQRRRDREQELRDIEDAARDMTAALGASRVSEDEIVRKAVALRRQAAVLEGKRDQRTAGMRNLRDRLQRRINIKLARAPQLVASSAPAPARIECSHGVPIGAPCPGCEAVEAARQVEKGAAPPLPCLDAPVVESSSPLAHPPEEKTPVVEVLDDGTPLGCAPGPAEESMT
jgi:hypothetical protein